MEDNEVIENIWDAIDVLEEDGKREEKTKNLYFIYGNSSTILARKAKKTEDEYSLVLNIGYEEGYGENPLLFMSYGKPNRRMNTSGSPVFLYFDMDEIKMEEIKVLPFDSKKFIDEVLDKNNELPESEHLDYLSKHFEINHLDRKKINKYICCVYGDRFEYYECDRNKRVFSEKPVHPEINDYIEIVLGNGLDEHSGLEGLLWKMSTLEVQCFEDVDCMTDDGFKLRYVLCSQSNANYYKKIFKGVNNLEFVPYDMPSYPRVESHSSNKVDRWIHVKGWEIIQGVHV